GRVHGRRFERRPARSLAAARTDPPRASRSGPRLAHPRQSGERLAATASALWKRAGDLPYSDTLWPSLHGPGPVPRYPGRQIAKAPDARPKLWLDYRNADQGAPPQTSNRRNSGLLQESNRSK